MVEGGEDGGEDELRSDRAGVAGKVDGNNACGSKSVRNILKASHREERGGNRASSEL